MCCCKLVCFAVYVKLHVNVFFLGGLQILHRFSSGAWYSNARLSQYHYTSRVASTPSKRRWRRSMASWFPKGDLEGSLGNPPAFRSSFQIRACMCLLVQRESKKDGVHNSAVCFWTSYPVYFWNLLFACFLFLVLMVVRLRLMDWSVSLSWFLERYGTEEDMLW